MKLIKCHIENFGKLNNYDHDFSDGVDTVLEDNGWGKTTFASFIRVMFFGFDNDGARKELENERKHYTPWQGGVYGGSVTFEANGKMYRMERTFGDKKSGTDTYALYDLATNIESSDFTENIGEELFQINAESFKNTVFISQNTCATNPDVGISAKIGDAAGIERDMANYNEVSKNLGEEINKLSPTRIRNDESNIKYIDGKINRLKADVRHKADTEESVDDLEKKIKELSDSLEEKKEQRDKISEEIAIVSAQNSKKGDAKEYKLLKQSYDEAEDSYNKEKAYFPVYIPETDQVDLMMDICNDIRVEKQKKDNNTLSGDDHALYERYKDTFSESKPDDAEINDLIRRCSEKDAKAGALETRKANAALLKTAQTSSSNNKNGLWILLVVGIPLLIAGIVLMVLSNIVIGAVLAAVGVILAVVGLVAGKKGGNGSENANEEVSTEYQKLMDGIKEDEEFIASTEKAVKEYLAKYYDREIPQDEYVACLSELRNNSLRFETLKTKQDNYVEAEQKISANEAEIDSFLAGLGFTDGNGFDGDYHEKLSDINNHISGCKFTYDQMDKCKKDLVEFEASHDMDFINEIVAQIESDGGDMEDDKATNLNEEFRQLNSEIEGLKSNIDSYRKRRDDLASDLEEMDEKENEIKNLEEKRGALSFRHQMLTKTLEYLEKAKMQFTSKYMEPVNSSFDKYYGQVSHSDDNKKYELDANLNLKLREAGISRDLGFLSEGYSDVVGLCRRMSFIDAMYKEEKPFIIMDDPFESMDDEHLKGALDLINYISKSYQVIYFTCHSSRKP